MTYQRPRLPSQLTYNDLNGQEATQIIIDWVRQLLQAQPLLQPHLTLPMARININLEVNVEMHIGGTVPASSEPELLTIAGDMVLDNKVQSLSAVVNVAPIAGGVPPDKIREQHDLPIPSPTYGPRETGSHLFLSDGPQALAAILDENRPVERTDGVRTRDAVDSSPQTQNSKTGSATGGREGIVADGYVFSTEVVNNAPVEQRIEVGRGGIDIDLTGQGRMKQGGMVITAGTHIASKKVAGDQGGNEYGSVGTTYDLGPAGLARPGAGGGLYRDGRPRISYGNNNNRG